MTDTSRAAAARPSMLGDAAPGVALAAAIAAAAYGLHQAPFLGALSPMILAILIGIGLRNTVGAPAWAGPGIAFSMRRLLRLAIILLGLQLTAAQVVQVGAVGVAIIAAVLIATFAFTVAAGRLMGVDRKLAQLIAAGTSICGASAVIAVNTVAEAPDEDVAYAVACVTVFGSLSMALYPLLPGLLHLDPRAYGLWTGASIHEIAQVVAAAYQPGKAAGDFGTMAKLTRVMMLAPMVIGLGFLAARRRGGPSAGGARKAPPTPWFVIGFIAMVGINSVVPIPPGAKAVAVAATTFLLSAALAAMGLETDVRKLRAKGLRPLLLGAAAWLFISGFSLALVTLAG